MTTCLHDAIKRGDIYKSVFKGLVTTSVNLTFLKKEVLKHVPCTRITVYIAIQQFIVSIYQISLPG